MIANRPPRAPFLLFFVWLIGIAALAGACVSIGGGGDNDEEPAEGDRATSVAATAEAVGTISLRLEMALDPAAEARARAITSDLGEKHAVRLEEGVAETDAMLRLSYDATPEAVESSLRLWGVYTGFWSPQETWNPDDAASTPLILAEELRLGIEAVLPPDTLAAAQWVSLNQIETALDTQPGAVTLLPATGAPSTLRSLSIDGIDPVRGEGDVEAWPLREVIYLSWDFVALEGFARDLAQRLPEPAPEVTRLIFAGDIIPARCSYARQRDLNDFAAAFRPTAEVLSAADITIGSLDAAISDVGEPFGCHETFNLLAPPETMEGLELAGFDALAVATNHIADCGTAGIYCEGRAFMDTLDRLRAAGMEPFGGGEDLEAAHTPAVIERNGVRFAFLAYDEIAAHYYGATETAPGTAMLDRDLMLRDIEAARLIADVIVVVPHWGEEYNHDPSSHQLSLARDAIEAGATLVVGNHPHVAQGVEWQGEGFAAYSLGNFVFDQDWSLPTQQGYVLETTFHGDRLAGARVLPIRIIDQFQPTWAEPGEAAQIMGDVEASSRHIAER